MTESIRWAAGDERARLAAERWLGGAAAQVLGKSEHRRIVRIDDDTGSLLVKRFGVGSGKHPWRERLRGWLDRGPAEREWRALGALHAAGLPVPERRAQGRLADGDRVLVMEFVAGLPLNLALDVPGRERRALLDGLGRVLRRLHASGHVHGDLHFGNVLVGAAGPVLLDLQRVRRTRSVAAPLGDLGHLDHALTPFLSTADRVRLRAAALGAVRPFDAATRAALRAVGEASQRRTRQHAASRRRHAARRGRGFESLHLAGARGLRVRALPESSVAAAVAAHRAALAAGDVRVLEKDGRGALCRLSVEGHHLVSKESVPPGLLRRLADTVRGSPGRRAFAGGHGLQILAVGAALPLAYLEWRRFGLPSHSLVLLEDLHPDAGAHDVLARAEGAEREAALDALLALVLRLHRARVEHGDLKGSNVLLRPRDGGFDARLVDLESVRFRRVLPDRARIRALAELNASIGDALDTASRTRWFARYAQALGFTEGTRAVRKAIARESLARRHRWSGAGCETATAEVPITPAGGGSRSTGT